MRAIRALKATKETKVSETEYVNLECGFCGKKGGAYVAHYDRVACSCGKVFWALRPDRHGPLELRPWPGLAIRLPEETEAA